MRFCRIGEHKGRHEVALDLKECSVGSSRSLACWLLSLITVLLHSLGDSCWLPVVLLAPAFFAEYVYPTTPAYRGPPLSLQQPALLICAYLAACLPLCVPCL
jgi:hypothetical protein